MTLNAHLEPLLAQSTLPLSPLILDRLEQHYALLVKWNRAKNLTRVIAPRAAAQVHYADCLFALDASPIKTWPRLVDVGSGAGFPGLIAAILEPERPVTLIEKVAKKASFLQEAARTLALKNVEVRASALNESDDVDYLCTRATFAHDTPLFEFMLSRPHVFFLVGQTPGSAVWEARCAEKGRVGRRIEYTVPGLEHRAVLTVGDDASESPA